MSRKLRIGGACLNQIPMAWAHNIHNIKSAIDEAKNDGIDLLCLPELSLTGYGCEDMFLSDWLPTTALEKLEIIKSLSVGIIVTIGLPVRFENKLYNCCAILGNGHILGIYAKHNLANDGVHYEPRWFSSWPYGKIDSISIGDKIVSIGAITLELNGVRTGFEICEDAWQEDRPACNFADKSIELILNPSASHFAFGKELFREDLVVSSSEQFDCVYLYSNLLGNEAGRMIYDGDVLIAQKGKLIGHNTRLSFREFNIILCDVDFDLNTATTTIKPDLSNQLEEMSQALPLALFDYLRKSKSKGFVLSLSGGADSSTIAIMVSRMVELGVEELGMDNFLEKINIAGNFSSEKEIVNKLLITAYQGTKNSSTITANSARELANSIGSTHYEWMIDDQVDGYTKTIEETIGRKLDWKTDDITLQNIQARSRSPIIWMLANIHNHLLLTTSNRSEGDVGYATMDGDTSGSISPIAAVDKHFIIQWLRYAEETLGYHGLKSVNALEPTAELRPAEQHQTDEQDLMPYEVLVAIERAAIWNKKSPVRVYQLLKDKYDSDQLKPWITKFFTLWSINQWKRERLAPSFHLDAFNVDPRTWCRFPILSSGFKEELENLQKV